MLYLSQVMIANQEMENFDDLKVVLKEFARRGEMHLHSAEWEAILIL